MCSKYTFHAIIILPHENLAPLGYLVRTMTATATAPYAILRTAKLSSLGSISSSGSHAVRVDGFAENADPTRTEKNVCLRGSPSDPYDDVLERLRDVVGVDAETGEMKPTRKNGVLCIEFVLTTSPGFFQGKSHAEVMQWAEAQDKFLHDKFGKNYVSGYLHLDETTPHVSAYVIPEVEGKMNCRAILGGRDKCSALQTEYAKEMQRFGLVRGIEGSKAQHQPIKKFYAELNTVSATADEAIKSLRLETPKPPKVPEKRGFLESEESYQARKTAVDKENRAYLIGWHKRQLTKMESVVADLAKQTVVAKMENHNLLQENRSLSRDLADVTQDKVALEEQAKLMDDPRQTLTKDEISVLRKLDVSLVAQRLNYPGEIPFKANAIDLVKEVGGFDFEQAVNWLANEFGADQAGGAVAQYTAIKKPERPFTSAETKIKHVVANQLDSLGCDKYRITLLSNRKEVKPFLPGKRGDEERFYTKRDIQNMIPYLRLKNNEGYGISITPMDDNAYYVLLDDAKISPERINEIGLEPCLIQKTSPNSVQAVFKLPRNLDRQDVIKVFNRLNRTAGDPKMTGLRHPFRLAGFKNTKEKHLQPDGKRPFVTVEFTSNRFSQTLAQQCSVAPIHEEVQNELYETLEAAVAAESRNNKMRGPS